MIIGDEIKCFAALLKRDSRLNHAEIIADMENARRLNARKDAQRFLVCHGRDTNLTRTHLINRRRRVARDLRLRPGARRKHIRMDLRPTSNAASDSKICNPLGLSNGDPLAALLLSHRALW